MALRPCSVPTKIEAFDHTRPKQTQRPRALPQLGSIPVLVVLLAMPIARAATTLRLTLSTSSIPTGGAQAFTGECVFQARRSLLNFVVGRTIRTIGYGLI